MARHGKIARLPKWLRDTLNIKLRDGESGVAVVAWLKALWEANEVVADAVGEEPVNEQNLSAWRQGGYRHWERRQAAAELVHGLAEHVQDLKQEADGLEVSDRLSIALTGELARVAEAMEDLQHKRLWGTICAAGMANKKGATESDRVVAAAMADSVFGLPPGTINLSANPPAKCRAGSAEFPLRSEASAGQGGMGTEERTENPPSSDYGVASEGGAEPVVAEPDKWESSKIKENQGGSETQPEEPP